MADLTQVMRKSSVARNILPAFQHRQRNAIIAAPWPCHVQ
ncbi:hypothetical protein AF72_08395 [Xylella taiwanensis]|uniref:Uncharacterized protein n=1 Tax=Xylella taiwanensis TaxID=1444770 RepID=Z9JHU8_9GAMM|nr:hypothetical protein AF72_08395 [Xylella taiwanensis]